MLGVPIAGAASGLVSFTASTTWRVPANVTVLRRLVLRAPGGWSGASATSGSAAAGGGGGGGGEIAVVTNVPVVPNTTLVITLAGGVYKVEHPTLGPLQVEPGVDGQSAANETSPGSGGDGGWYLGFGAGGGAPGVAGDDGIHALDTSTWSGLSIDRYGGGGGGGGDADADIIALPSVSGGDGGALGGLAAGGGGGSPIPYGGGGGGQLSGGVTGLPGSEVTDTSGGSGTAALPPAVAHGTCWIEY